jgi:hypothetical protein
MERSSYGRTGIGERELAVFPNQYLRELLQADLVLARYLSTKR